jgi:hypothetical protein
MSARSLGHCTAHTVYEHDCPYCRNAELQVARWSDVKTDEALTDTLRRAVEERDALQKLVTRVNADWREAVGALRKYGGCLEDCNALSGAPECSCGFYERLGRAQRAGRQ